MEEESLNEDSIPNVKSFKLAGKHYGPFENF